MARVRPGVFKLTGKQDIFHDYKWLVRPSSLGEKSNRCGRPPNEWTPQLSRQLITLVIHTDIAFDDIPAALKDEKGRGPCKSKCRDHWYEISGYHQRLVRLSNKESQKKRKKQQEAAFREFQQREALTNSGPPSANLRSDTRRGLPAHVKTSGIRQKTAKSIEEIENKYRYPRGFVTWIKQAGLQLWQDSSDVSSSSFSPGINKQQSLLDDEVTQNGGETICSILSGLQSTDPNISSFLGRVEMLIQTGTSANEANWAGESPLHLAVALGHIPIMTLLLEYGAHPGATTRFWEDIWTFAGRISQDLMTTESDSSDTLDLLTRTRACVRIEFARSTVRFNSNLTVAGKSTWIRRTIQNISSMNHQEEVGYWTDHQGATQGITTAFAATEEIPWHSTNQLAGTDFLTELSAYGVQLYGQQLLDEEGYLQYDRPRLF